MAWFGITKLKTPFFLFFNYSEPYPTVLIVLMVLFE